MSNWLDEPEAQYIRRVIHETITIPCPRCGARAGMMCINLHTKDEAQSTCYERRGQEGYVGPGRTITYALAIWPTDIISRATLRAFLPRGTTTLPGGHGRLTAFRKGQTIATSKRNRTSDAFKKILKELEDAGLIYRGTEFVRVVNRRALLDRAIYSVENPQHEQFLELERAANQVRQDIRREIRPKVKHVREQELAVIMSLMQPDHYSGRDGSRRSVRHESGEIVVPLGETARRWNPTKNKDMR